MSDCWTISKSTGRETSPWDALPDNLKAIIKREDGFEITQGDYHYRYRDSFGGEGLVFRWKDKPSTNAKWTCFVCTKTEPSLPFKCKYCGQNFCSKHRVAEMHDCIKTRYVKYIRKTWLRKYGQNITTGFYHVSCDACGYKTEPVSIEQAGADRQAHVDAGCLSEKVFLEDDNLE